MTEEEIAAEQAILHQQQNLQRYDFEQAATTASEVPDDVADAISPADLFNADNYTDKKTRISRFDTCKGCERLFKPTKSCKECGCFMALKTWLKDATCPLGKW